MKKIIFSLLLFTGILIPAPAEAAESCISDYYSFILRVRSENTRNEYFKDFATLGYCQVNDMIEINDGLDQLRDTFRTAASNCEDTSQYKEKYNELLMEAYFIRNIQKTPSDVIDDDEVDKITAQKASKLTRLRREMQKIFVTEEARATEDELNAYFDKWSSKYDDKIVKYAACDEGPWAELTGTWNKFIETMKSIKIKPDKQEYTPPSTDIWRANISKNIVDYYNKFKEDRVEKISDKKTVGEAVSSAGTFVDVYDLLNQSAHTYDTEMDSAERMARYQILYGEGGARVSSDFQTLMKELNKIIQTTNNVEFKEIKKRVGQVESKQCK